MDVLKLEIEPTPGKSQAMIWTGSEFIIITIEHDSSKENSIGKPKK